MTTDSVTIFTMHLRTLGSSKLYVSPVIFGAWAIGGWMWGGTDETDAIAAIHASIDNGVNTIDTAAVYGMGDSEKLVGRAIQGRRDGLIVATKCGMRWDSEEGCNPWPQKDNDGKDVVIRRNSKPASIVYECEQSLKRLGVDVIDLFQIHWPDTSTAVEDSIAALAKLRDAGKIRAIGVSNYDEKWLAGAIKVAPVASNQPPYSLIQRGIERGMVPFCRRHNIGLIVYSPMERGLLTGAVGPERTFAPGDHRAGHKFFTVENRQCVAAALAKIKPIADARGMSLAQLVIQWTIHQPGITAAIVGARNAKQAAHNAQAMKFSLTATELTAIRAAFDEPSRVMTA
ncbi:MAG: aldo/keto reductase [Tepidisphaerales bacterium]